ncbi:hypothetical protein QJQ45_019301 [Haematococcus lacustris]|nr:hypothetical protein QJQ45_019301 [Haematococcus lacustris]
MAARIAAGLARWTRTAGFIANRLKWAASMHLRYLEREQLLGHLEGEDASKYDPLELHKMTADLEVTRDTSMLTPAMEQLLSRYYRATHMTNAMPETMLKELNNDNVLRMNAEGMSGRAKLAMEDTTAWVADGVVTQQGMVAATAERRALQNHGAPATNKARLGKRQQQAQSKAERVMKRIRSPPHQACPPPPSPPLPAHQEVQGENESLEQLAEERTHAIQMLQQDKRRLSLALRNVRRCRVSGPRLTRHQRQLMNILMRHQVSPEVLQRCAEGGYGIPSGTAAQQPCPSPDPPAFTTNFIPTQVGRCGKPAARTAAYLAQHYLSTARLVLQTQLHSKLQQLVPADQREHQKQQLATYLQQHCAAMEEYYTQHCKRQLDMPHLMAALGGSDPQSCKEVAAKVVKCVALLMNDGQTDLGVWDPHSTWHQFSQDIQAMAEGSPCSTRLRLHLEVYFLACPTSNAPVESLLQLLKHGAGRFMELPALLEHMSLHTLRTTLNSVDVHDFTLQMPKLRTAVRLEEVAAASASAPARAARKATAAACCVGGFVVNVGTMQASSGWQQQQRQQGAAKFAARCQPPPHQPPQQQGRSSWGTALEGQMLAPPIASPQGPIASPDLRHMYQLALAAIATQGQAAPAQGSELGAATPAPGFTLRKRTTPSEGLPKTAAKRKG